MRGVVRPAIWAPPRVETRARSATRRARRHSTGQTLSRRPCRSGATATRLIQPIGPSTVRRSAPRSREPLNAPSEIVVSISWRISSRGSRRGGMFVVPYTTAPRPEMPQAGVSAHLPRPLGRAAGGRSRSRDHARICSKTTPRRLVAFPASWDSAAARHAAARTRPGVPTQDSSVQRRPFATTSSWDATTRNAPPRRGPRRRARRLPQQRQNRGGHVGGALVVQLRRRDAVAAARRVEEVAQHSGACPSSWTRRAGGVPW